MKPHAPLDAFTISNEQLLIGNHTAAELENLVGSTPLYAYDKTIMANQVKQLKNVLPSQVKLHYAIKANPLPSLVHYMAGLVDGFDVASRKELLLAMQTSMPTSEISFAGPGKQESDLITAITAGATLHVESFHEFHQITAIAKRLAKTPNVAFRVNPSFELKASGMKMAGGAKPFGIDQEQLMDFLPSLDTNLVRLKGFHIYTGSQNLNATSLIEAHTSTIDLAKQLLSASPCAIQYVNIGGGFGIPYFPGESHLDVIPIVENLKNLLQQEKSIFGEIDIILELGRYLVGEAGVYITKVIDKKESRGETFVVCDGGLHHHLANSGNFGQVIRKNYPVVIANKMEAEPKEKAVNIVGPLCTPLDIIANKVILPDINIGDYVAVMRSGAYGATASPINFLSQSSVYEILL
ncbi:pyridoxal-dependent decarboxylase, exosortase A system-associated [Thalassotalea fusca]